MTLTRSIAMSVGTGVVVGAGSWAALNLTYDVWMTASRDLDAYPRAVLLLLAVGLIVSVVAVAPHGTGLVAALVLAAPLIPYLFHSDSWLPDFVPGNPLQLAFHSATWAAIWTMIAIDVFDSWHARAYPLKRKSNPL